jgi:serine protease
MLGTASQVHISSTFYGNFEMMWFKRTAKKPIRNNRRRLGVGMETLEERRLLAGDITPLAYSFLADADQHRAEDRIPGEIVIGFRPGASGDQIRGLASAHGISALQSIYMGIDPRTVKSATVPEHALDTVLRALRNNPLVDYAEPSFVASAFLTPNDSLFKFQWHLQNSRTGSINVSAAWDVTTGSGVTVAVLDTGVAYENRSDSTGTYYVAPDLAQTRFVSGYDFVNGDAFANDDHSHGTHVAGTIAQSTNNSIGTAGVAHGASIMPVKVLNRDGSGSHAAIAQGIRWAADHGSHIINLSLGSASGSTTLRDALAYAYGKGVTIVAAAGNNGTNAVSYPAAYDNYVIAVSATRYDESIASYSNFGSSIDLAAPGGDLSVDQNRDGYADGVLQNTFNPSTKNMGDFGYYFFQGTSMAAPHVSGVAALVASVLLQQGDSAHPDTIRSILQSTARDKGPTGVDIYYGHGIVDAAAAVSAARSRINAAPIAVDDFATTNKDQAVVLNVLANDSDPDGDALSIINFTQPADGSVTSKDNRFTYTPSAGFIGTDSFSYTIADPAGLTSTAVVTIAVNDVSAATTVRVADLDGSVGTQRNQWRALVSTLVVDGNNVPVSGATVNGHWGDGKTASWTTDSSGLATSISAWQNNKTASITFTVTNVVVSGLTYTPTANSDLDGDSDGTRITVRKDGTTSSAKSSSDAEAATMPPAVNQSALRVVADLPSAANITLLTPLSVPVVATPPQTLVGMTKKSDVVIPAAPQKTNGAAKTAPLALSNWDLALGDLFK